MKAPRSLVGSLSFTLFKKFLPIIFFVVAIIATTPFLILYEKFKMEIFRTTGFLLLSLGFLATIFTSREVLIRMEQDDAMLFSDALAHTLYRYLTFICFLPLLGPPLQRFLERKRAKNPFTSDEK